MCKQITSFQSSLPLKLQLHQTLGFGVCFIVMAAVYYGNAWDSRSLPFMSTRLLTQEGKRYPSTKVFVNGVLDKAALAKYGLPRLTGTFAYAMFMANAAVSQMRNLCFNERFSNELKDWSPHCPHRPFLGR